MVDHEKSVRMVITGGGTGGHLFPAIATAQKLCDDFPKSEVLFIGTVRKMDQTSLSQYGFETKAIHCYGLKGKNLYQTLKALFFLPLSLIEALYTLFLFKPQVVVGVGGYVTAPVIIAAKILSLPTLIHEQNSIPGLANRKLGLVVDRICYSIPGSKHYFPREKTVFTGNPVRHPILELARRNAAPDSDHHGKTLLVLGGSQGAHVVNELIVQALTEQKEMLPSNIQVIHQTGSKDEQWVTQAYEESGVRAEVAGFFKDMDDIYSKADLLVSRAGATTLAELAVLGKPAILIPFPSAADDHQMKNGEYYSRGGGAILYRQDEMTGEKLAAIIGTIFAEPGKLDSMGEAMSQMGVTDASERIVACCLELLIKRK